MRKVVAVVLVAVLAFCWLAFNRGMKVDVQCGPVVTTPLMTKGYRGAKTFGESLRLFTDGEVTAKDIVTGLMGMLHTISVYTDAIKRGFHDEKDSKEGKAYERATRQAQSKALASCCPAAPVDPTPPGIEEPPNDGKPVEPPFDPRVLSTSLASVSSDEGEAQTLAIAQTAIAVGKQRGLGEQAWVVIVATGMQESGGGQPWLLNLNHGDRDSVGWLQQRPSQGWGTVSQIMQPAYAATKFYEALERVPGWESLPVTVAAQKVQRSAYPNAYAKWEQPARDLVARAGGSDVAPLLEDPEDPATPAYCNPSSAEQNLGGGGALIPTASLAAFTKATAEAQISNPRTPQQALAWLAKQQGNTSSRCLHFVAAAYGYNSTKPHPSPIDGGQWGADEQWRLIPAQYKHSPAEPAPPGAVMWWDGGNVDGHVALSLGNGMVRSTGVGAGGGVGDKPLAYFSGYGNFVGWSLPFWSDRSTIGVAA